MIPPTCVLTCDVLLTSPLPFIPLQLAVVGEEDQRLKLLVFPLSELHVSEKHMWQSRVEIEYYSIAHFNRITVFQALYL